MPPITDRPVDYRPGASPLIRSPQRRVVQRHEVTQRVPRVDEGVLEDPDQQAGEERLDDRRVGLERVGDGADGVVGLDERPPVCVHLDESADVRPEPRLLVGVVDDRPPAGPLHAFGRPHPEFDHHRHDALQGGVDIVQGEDGYCVLEVNPTAGFRGLFEATGRSPAPAIVELAVERVGGEVDEARVRELSSNLDDSRPACMPRREPEQPIESLLIGYIEEVVIMGTAGQKSVLAKSDTGATRTSIDAGLAAKIGIGPIEDIVKVCSGSLEKSKSRPVVDLVVGVGGRQHTVTVSVEDREHMDYPLLLGQDILQHYHVDVRKRADEGEPVSLRPTEE